MRVRLIKKLAEMIDGIDLNGREPGDVLDLEFPEARLLVAEGWAVPEDGSGRRRYMSAAPHSASVRGLAADRPKLAKLQRLGL